MAIGRLPIGRATVVAYYDVLHAAQAMRGLFLLALLTVLFIDVTGYFLSPDLPATAIGNPQRVVTAAAVGIPLRILRAVLLTPVLVAVHRFILLGDASDRYAIEPHSPRFFRFVFWSLALPALFYGPGVLWLALSLALGLPLTIGFVGLPICLVVGVIVDLRLTVLLPAIAVDAPGATASNSIADTRGFAIDIFLIYLLALLPIFATQSVLRRLNAPVIDVALGVIFDVAVVVLLVVISSRVFQAVADRTLRSASP
jgi:hypothetical protein